MKKSLFVAALALVVVSLGTGWARAGQYELKFGTTNQENTVYFQAMKLMKEEVEKRCPDVNIALFPNSELGGERDLVEGVAMGTVEMCYTSSGPLSSISSEFTVFDLPFIVRDRETVYRVFDGPLGQQVLDNLESKGIKGFGFWDGGYRFLTNDKEPLLHPEQIKGMKIRTMENPVHVRSFVVMGANPTPMAWPEVFSAIQQGVIQGHENNMASIYNTKIYEIQKFVSLTGHFYSPGAVLINKALFDSLPEQAKNALIEGEKIARDWERAQIVRDEKELAEKLTSLGVTVSEVDKNEWFEASKATIDSFKDKINMDIYQALTE